MQQIWILAFAASFALSFAAESQNGEAIFEGGQLAMESSTSLIDRIREEGHRSVAEDYPNLFYLTSTGVHCGSARRYEIQIFGLSHGITLRQQALASACSLVSMMAATDLVESDIAEARIVAIEEAEALQVIRILRQQNGLRNTMWDIELVDRIEPANPGIRYRIEVAAIASGTDDPRPQRGYAPAD